MTSWTDRCGRAAEGGPAGPPVLGSTGYICAIPCLAEIGQEFVQGHTVAREVSSPRELRAPAKDLCPHPPLSQMLLDFHGPAPPGSPPGCSSLRRSPASELPPALPGSWNHRPPPADSSLSLGSSTGWQGALRVPSPLHSPVAWPARARPTDVRAWVRRRCWAEKQQPGGAGVR